MVAAQHAFWKCTFQQLLELGTRHEVEGVRRNMSLAELLEVLIRHFLPEATDVEIYEILWRRRPKVTDVDSLVDSPDVADMMDESDRQQFEKHLDSKKAKAEDETRFWQRLLPLRKKCKACYERQEAAKASDARKRGPVQYRDEELTQDLCNTFVPPSMRLFRDPFNARWRGYWSGGDISRSGIHGYRESLMLVLRELWQQWTLQTDVPCTVPGRACNRGAGQGIWVCRLHTACLGHASHAT